MRSSVTSSTTALPKGRATRSEYDTAGSCIKAAIVYLGTTLIKEVSKALIGFSDVAGLYFALTQLTYRNISQTHKFQQLALDGRLLTQWYIHISASLDWCKGS
ncbi:hypothetical protein R1flu_003568 [Riccia fluitans]|uniref:BOS complex subunit TMEM147 n=1 Tax=Riccia fluitans TaxID=41844 RepID=A0ABD1Y9E1_9MARC